MERKSEHQSSGGGGRKSGGGGHHHNSNNNNNSNSGGGNNPGGGGGGSNNNANSNSQLAAAAAALAANEPNLAELFAAHNLLASSGMAPGGPGGANPLALFQQQMNMQYANPAAWWYLEYLSRIQAAQMVPNLQAGNASGGATGSSGRGDRERSERETNRSNNTNNSSGTELKKNDKRNMSESSASHSNLPPSKSSHSNLSRPPSRKSDKETTNSRPGSRRGRIPGGSGNSASNSNSNASHLNSTASVAALQHLNLSSQPIPATTRQQHHDRDREPSQQQPPPSAAPTPLLNHQALNLSKTTPKLNQSQSSSDPSKSLNLPSSVTIIPHAHSKPDSLTCPRFPSDYVPKPAHAAVTTLYSHVIPKYPQVGLVKSDKNKRKSTVASLLQQSRAAGGGVEITPKPEKANNKSDRFESDREKPLKLDKPNSNKHERNVSPASGSGRQTPERSQIPNTPPHRPWLNATELNIPQPKPKQEPDLNSPLANGWRRETLLKSLSANGLNGDVSYISPSNVTVKSMAELKKLVGHNGLKNYSFSSKLLIGDFLVPNDDGVLKLTSDELANWLKEEARQNKKEEERLKRERERKKEHAGIVRALEAYRRSKRRYKQQQERKQRKREALEPEVKPEPVEVDELLTDKKLPELEEIVGLKLSPPAFANMLHIYEFLHTFGNTLGFDMDSLPTLSNLQKAFLHIDESEEELLSVLSHLLVCAVEDPGMPNPNKHMTAFGQTLKQADITFGSLSEVLRLYLTAVSDSEPEAEKFSEWLNEAPFLALSPTRKSTIISFICDLLLQNKAVLKHLETSTETAHTARKDRQQNEIKIRKLRMLSARKTVAAVAAEVEKGEDDDDDIDSVKKEIKMEESLEMSNHKDKEDNNESGTDAMLNDELSTATTPEKVQIKQEPEMKEHHPMNIEESTDSVSTLAQPPPSEIEPKKENLVQSDLEHEPKHSNSAIDITINNKIQPPDDDASYLSSSSSSAESDSDAKLSTDEIRSKINTLQKTADKLKQLQVSSMRVIRSHCLGQDRYRRRYWNLPAAGGFYIEGGQSGEFDDLKLLVKEKLSSKLVVNGIEEPKKDTNDQSESKASEEESEETTAAPIPTPKENEPFQVPPPCIKIFSFAPREGCSGKVKPLPVKEQPSEDDNFLSVVEEKYWNGWWKLENNVEEFVQELCPTGIREAPLKTALAGQTSPHGLVEDEFDDEEIPTNVQSPENGWDPELAYKVHQQLLETLETLEERVASASLQVKGWQLPPKPEENLTEEEIIQVVKDRLLDLESAVERRYLKPPLGKSAHELNLANLTDGGGENYVGPRALTHWRDAISKATTPSVLSMAIYSLDSSIAWDKSVMKASCQLCKGGDNEDQLLLCDACDRGYHTYCFKPPLDTIPEGDWFCWECINKATGVKGCIVCGKGGGKLLACDKCVKAFHIDCINPPLPKVPRGRWHCPDHKSPTKKRKSDTNSESPGPSKKSAKKSKSEMALCEKLLDDLSRHEDAWPFLEPVNTRQFPTYKKIIKNPIDLATIRSRMPTYKNKLEFLTDIRLIFDNCLTFNEDDSPVGKAGHNLRLFFEAASSKL